MTRKPWADMTTDEILALRDETGDAAQSHCPGCYCWVCFPDEHPRPHRADAGCRSDECCCRDEAHERSLIRLEMLVRLAALVRDRFPDSHDARVTSGVGVATLSLELGVIPAGWPL